MPRGLNRSGNFLHGNPVNLPKEFGTPITLPKNFGTPVVKPFQGSFSDNFNRPDQFLSVNPNWLDNNLETRASIVNNQLTTVSNPQSIWTAIWATPILGDAFIQVTITGTLLMALAFADAPNEGPQLLSGALEGVTTWFVIGRDGAFYDTGVPMAPGDVVRLTKLNNGALIKATINGQNFYYQDTNPALGAQSIFLQGFTDPVLDFSGGTINSTNEVAQNPVAFGNIVP